MSMEGATTAGVSEPKTKTRELSPDTILTFTQWYKLAGISKNTGAALRASGQAPRFVQISRKLIGTTVAEHRAWLASRMEARLPDMPERQRRRRAT